MVYSEEYSDSPAELYGTSGATTKYAEPLAAVSMDVKVKLVSVPPGETNDWPTWAKEAVPIVLAPPEVVAAPVVPMTVSARAGRSEAANKNAEKRTVKGRDKATHPVQTSCRGSLVRVGFCVP